ncbi:diguanylate cyclase [Halomonas sp. McH1-25]|uniref:diguanylate cyclase domain-containing protein n=1 Tax=unclassified Halomonas TaxID=2609666 RepID=UPI001EF4D748|nr:diguanylate cyclase [Halomonas sp. McH1-25]MCP1342333.1 diguanylate cyclase [Halomonas sp. FL8]MCP1360413.1 diguanylate cyclase [Halomonas sp. BBD45]MCP1365012.1 diguanylate cyclase [Halomonas sp. BBD48]
MRPRMEGQRWPSFLFVLVYAIGAVLLAGYAIWHYLMGAYNDILIPASMSVLLSGAIFLRFANRDYRHLSAYLALISCYLLIAMELPRQELALLWMGLPPVLTLLLLPQGSALLLNLTLMPIWLALLGIDLPLLETALYYLALVGFGTLPGWMRHRRAAMLRATEPSDAQCDALSRKVITERLTAEVDRARSMRRPMAALVIHLPQLEMADEQFGSALLHAILARVCQTIRESCRHHDLLGRHQPTLFWLLLPDTGEAGALIVRDRVMRALNREVFAETGAIQARIHACYLHPGETTTHFEQRLLTAGLKLMEPSP